MCVASSNSSAASAAMSARADRAGERERLAAVLAARSVSPTRSRTVASSTSASRPLEVRGAEGEHGLEVRGRLLVRCRADRLGRGLPAVVDGLVDRRERDGGGEVAGELGEHRPAIGGMDLLDALGRRAKWARRRPTWRTAASTVSRTIACSNSNTRPVIATEQSRPAATSSPSGRVELVGRHVERRCEDFEVDPLPGDGGRLDRRPRRG